MLFTEKKEKGLVTTEVDNTKGELYVTFKHFDSLTGTETEPTKNTLLKTTLTSKVEELRNELTDTEAMLKEFDQTENPE